MTQVTLSVCLCLLSPFAASCWAADDFKAPASSHLDELIRQLGSKDFKVRSRAERRLRDMPEAVPYLKVALRSSDNEIHERCRRILADMKIPCTSKVLQRAMAFAMAGRIELAIEQLVAVDPDPNDEKYWQCVFDVAALVRDKAIEYYRQEIDVPLPWRGVNTPAEFFEKCNLNQPESISSRAILKSWIVGRARAGVIDANTITGIGICSELNCANGGGIVLTQNVVRFTPSIKGTVLVAGETRHATGKSWLLLNSIVICRGEIPYLNWIDNSIIVSSSTIGVKPSTIRKGKCVIKENEPKPLGFIQWFETEQIGVQVSDMGGKLRISKLDEGKAFARAGCKVGDQIWSVNDKHFDTPEEFRLALRRAVIDGTASLTIVRDKKPIELEIPIELE